MSGAATHPAADRFWPHPRALLIDAMGTLFGLRESVGLTYAAVAAGHGLSLHPPALDRAFAAAYGSAPPLAFPGLGGQDLERAERAWWAARIDTVLEQLGVGSGTPALHRDLFDRFAEPDLWQVYAEVPATLDRWRGQGLRLAVVSNFDQRLEPLLEALDLRRWFDVVVISSRAGAAKPSPRPFLLALEQLQISAAEAWHIGDSPADATGARAAGLPCVLVKRP
ncbi:MAG: HAD-IA family hydrolase [Cyanobium sp.]